MQAQAVRSASLNYSRALVYVVNELEVSENRNSQRICRPESESRGPYIDTCWRQDPSIDRDWRNDTGP